MFVCILNKSMNHITKYLRCAIKNIFFRIYAVGIILFITRFTGQVCCELAFHSFGQGSIREWGTYIQKDTYIKYLSLARW